MAKPKSLKGSEAIARLGETAQSLRMHCKTLELCIRTAQGDVKRVLVRVRDYLEASAVELDHVHQGDVPVVVPDSREP